ncbi:DUF6415 family natural product biosynthesis protein [Streptomyces phaeolivaceus]|uniref:DUF6415 family natural product biosynthesis protein n=1 Tax=Streptomyces phaeolivaceus TaxID=2653200 RepID=UPI00186978C9|nr:DUF6415 family natural product biosynthesis protein [Streptomyces phaeolivaceus]
MEPNMPQRRTPKDRDRRAALASQAADIWPDAPSDTPEQATLPIDIETMRASARRLLVEDAELPSTEDELKTLILELRGYIMLAIPEVEAATGRLDEDDIPRKCALACVDEARTRLSLEGAATLPAGFAHAQRLARSVNALCDHFDNLTHPATGQVEECWIDTGSGPGRVVQVHVCVDEDPEAAYQRILDHGMTCPTCRALDGDGNAKGDDCGAARRLHLAWRMAQRQLAERR